MSTNIQTTLQEIADAAKIAAPVAGVFSPAAGIGLAALPGLMQIVQQVIANQSSTAMTPAELTAQWVKISTQDQATSTAIQAYVAKEVAAHKAASASAAPVTAAQNVVTGPTPVAVP
jgi:hypothetical protein